MIYIYIYIYIYMYIRRNIFLLSFDFGFVLGLFGFLCLIYFIYLILFIYFLLGGVRFFFFSFVLFACSLFHSFFYSFFFLLFYFDFDFFFFFGIQLIMTYLSVCYNSNLIFKEFVEWNTPLTKLKFHKTPTEIELNHWSVFKIPSLKTYAN